MEAALGKMRKAENGRISEAACADFTGKPSVKRAARDFYGADVEEYVVNEAESYRELLESGDFNGEGQPALRLHTDAIPLFEAYFLESQSEKALDEHVWLKSGGFLVIEETEACVVIDVNDREGGRQRGFAENDSENESGGGRGSGKADAP